MRLIFPFLAIISVSIAFAQQTTLAPQGAPQVVCFQDAGPRDRPPADSIFYTLPANEFWDAQTWRDKNEITKYLSTYNPDTQKQT